MCAFPIATAVAVWLVKSATRPVLKRDFIKKKSLILLATQHSPSIIVKYLTLAKV